MTNSDRDTEYLAILLRRLAVCKSYRPKFGQGQSAGLSLETFRELYGSDPFYSWFGLDTSRIYAAHRVAGGITSIYRQIGLGCEELFRDILRKEYHLTTDQVLYSYRVMGSDGRTRQLSLDARIDFDHVIDQAKVNRLIQWVMSAAQSLEISPRVVSSLRGVVFEVRQGYKSKDSKRQNADIANAATAYSQAYLPVALILSNQIDSDVFHRYQLQKWLVLRGTAQGHMTSSTYVFLREVIGYDLAGFFERNASIIKAEIEATLDKLLQTDD